MTSPPHIPPMPPVPREELAAAQGHPYPKTEAPAAPEPAAEEPSRTVITVRYNRRLGVWFACLGWPLLPVMLTLSVYLRIHGVESDIFMLMLWYPPGSAAVVGTMMLTKNPCLTYDTRTGLIGTGIPAIQRQLNRWKPGDRIEYSVYQAQLRIVRPNGRRWVLLRWWFILDRESWTAFVDVFLAHQIARAAAGPDLEQIKAAW